MSNKPKMTRNVGRITLGLEYTDALHNRSGIATCYAIHLTGCNRVCLEWKNDKGEVSEFWVDETRLEGVILNNPENGPGSDPPRRGIR